MTFDTAIQASTNLLAQLANPAGRSLILGVAAGAALAAFRVKTTSTRLFTWTAVLYAALAMPLLGWMLPPLPIPTPAFLKDVVSNAPVAGQISVATSDLNLPGEAAERRQNAALGASRG